MPAVDRSMTLLLLILAAAVGATVGIITDRAIRLRHDTWQDDARYYEELRLAVRRLMADPDGAPRRLGPRNSPPSP